MTARHSETREAYLIAWRDELAAKIAAGAPARDMLALTEQLLSVVTELGEVAAREIGESESLPEKRGMKPVGLGATGMHTARRVAELRNMQGLSYKRLSELLAQANAPIAALGLRRIESGARRVSVDDLVALADALCVSPIELLGRGAS